MPLPILQRVNHSDSTWAMVRLQSLDRRLELRMLRRGMDRVRDPGQLVQIVAYGVEFMQEPLRLGVAARAAYVEGVAERRRQSSRTYWLRLAPAFAAAISEVCALAGG